MNKRIQLTLGAALLLIALTFSFILNLPTANERVVTVNSAYGDKQVSIEASLWEHENAEYAVLICSGYSCDRQKWRPMADLLSANGLTVMTFDYSGQGASGGTIGFDNAKTDNIPVEISQMTAVLMNITGLDSEHIILMGHSMGGRSILRFLYDMNCEESESSAIGPRFANAILISPEVNYNFNAQASLFAGTSDDSDEPWHSYNADYIRGTNVYLFGSTADDIVSDEDILAIYSHLGGENVPESGKWSSVQTTSAGSKISVNVVGGVLHSYQMYSPGFAALVNDAVSDITGSECVYSPYNMLFVYGSWFIGLIGLFFTLRALTKGTVSEINDSVPALTDTKAFLMRKALMWLPGTAAALIICCLCVCMPFGSPVMNIPYMCFIAGYGAAMVFAYRKGTFKGTSGKLPKLNLRVKKGGAASSAAVTLILCFAVWYVLRASMYRLIPINARLFWVLLASVLMAIGYYVSGTENDMMERAGVSRTVKFVYNLITYVPLFLLVAFYLVLKSYSGLIGQVQNMVLMYIFCVPLGDFVRRKTGSRLWGAVVSAFTFQTLMITSAALISMF